MHRIPGKWYWLSLLLLLMAAWAYLDQRGFLARYDATLESNAQVESLRQELAAAQSQMSRLEERVVDLHGDPVEMEAAVRRNKNLVREDETLFRVLLPGEPGAE